MVAELGSVDPSLPRLSTLVEQEPATVARLLRVVNSAAFGLDRTVAAIPEAVALLGIEALRALVLAVHVHDSCAEAAGVDAEALWEHSMADARLARALTRTYGGTSAQIEAAFTAGLLHDCGRLVIASGFPQVGRASLAAVHAGDEPCAAEEAAGGPRHDLAGGWLLLRWGLPDQVVEAAAWHHHPERTPESPLVPLAAVQMADALLGEIACPARQPHEALLRCFGGAERLPGLRALADQVGRP
jgi:HD-like signal output (HDOD) protein